MLHVFNTANDEHVTIAGHDALRGSMQRAHRGATQSADGLRTHCFWQTSQQTNRARHVKTLFECLVNTTPDHIFDIFAVHVRVALKQCLHQFCGEVFGAHINKAATFGATHWRANTIDNHYISSLKLHAVSPLVSDPPVG